eukprot:6580675-Karenia_brevis.AAC.1
MIVTLLCPDIKSHVASAQAKTATLEKALAAHRQNALRQAGVADDDDDDKDDDDVLPVTGK